ncbi:heme-binding domain-containing protein [Ferruginibacter sp.]|nr:heme-binding domain-containing protein [Ferruginibacter sp.]
MHHILQISCYDCHSNNTFYPGYSKYSHCPLTNQSYNRGKKRT